jgi:antitoxin FitA
LTEAKPAKSEPDTRAMSIRGIRPDVYERLRVRAAEHGQSMEAEVREILEAAAERPVDQELEPENFADLIRRRFASSGGLADLMVPSRKDPSKLVPLGE